MANLKTKYMGIDLKNPIIIGASNLSDNIENAKKIEDAGAAGFLLFNKLFQPEIDIENVKYDYPYGYTGEHENKLPMRWAGLAYENIQGDICSSTGIYTGKDVIKMILSGATCTQSVSAIYKYGISRIGKMLNEINNWMDKNEYKEINDFRGRLSKMNIKDPYFYERGQYIDILLKNETIIKKDFMR